MAVGRGDKFAMDRAVVVPGVVVWMLEQGQKKKRWQETGWAGNEEGAAGDADSEREKKGKKIC